jgi:Flp pilus assembly pilin Flp
MEVEMKIKRKNKAQSTLEYIIVITSIVALILFATKQWIKGAVDKTFTDANTAIGKAANKL